MIATVPAAPGVTCEATTNFQHRCPVKDETDTGTITVRWTTSAVTVELHSLAAYLQRWADQAITHEDVVSAIAHALRDAGVLNTAATYRGATAGLDVTTTWGSVAVSSEPVRG